MAAGTYTAPEEKSDDQYGRERVKDFFFDYSYWSFDENSAHFTSQEKVPDLLFTVESDNPLQMRNQFVISDLSHLQCVIITVRIDLKFRNLYETILPI